MAPLSKGGRKLCRHYATQSMKRKAKQILKVDVIGRVWTPRGQQEAVLDELERSGMDGTKFADHIRV